MDDMYVTSKYKDSNPTWHEGDAPWKAQQVRTLLDRNNIVFSTLSEVGCGTGEILVQLSNAYPDAAFTGYEISPDAYEMATKREGARLSFHLADALSEPVPHADVVLVADVIEHVEDYIGFTRRIRALGDLKIFHIPLDLSAQSVVRMSPILNQRAGVGHIHYFTKDTALALLEDCGYRVLDWMYTASRLELPDQARSSRIVAPIRKALFRARPDLAVRVLGGYSLLVMAE